MSGARISRDTPGVDVDDKKRVTLTIIVPAFFDLETDTLWAESLGHAEVEVVEVHAETLIPSERFVDA